MTKKQENFLRMTLLGISVGCVLGGIYLMSLRGGTVSANKLYKNVTSLSLDEEYPETPEEVIKINNDISLYFYGGAAIAGNVSEIVGQQRKLLTKALLKANPKDAQIDKMKAEIRRYKRITKTMVSAEILETDYTNEEKDTCNVTVVQYVSNGSDQKILYEMIIEDGRWKINAWYSLN